MIEAESIPYEPAQLRGERLLVLAPHPDDEVIACGGLIAQHLREGRPVRVVVVTDGAQAGEAAMREEESRRGLERLGSAELVFLRFPDRGLDDSAAEAIREQLVSFRPDLILIPSPVEIHPDHIALSRVFCELVQRDETLFADLAVARVAFYEVSQPLRPNALVDITSVADDKYAAIAEHQSQLAFRDYIAYARGLNAYRTMTLPATCKFAEAYFVVELPSLRTTPFSAMRRRTGTASEIDVAKSNVVPISVVIRTKDRPALLREAIDSVRATGHPCEILVVNDGGARPEVEGVTLVEHETSRGRAEAGNAGVRAATNAFVAFLDDDDLFYPEHLATLANATTSHHAGWYTDAVSAFLIPGESGAYETRDRMRLFAQDFDRELLLLDNYIPLPTLLVPRQSFLDLGGFDSAFDLFEDWDFLIRLSRRGDLRRIPRLTCEVRHFEGGTSVVLAAPEGSDAFRAAKLRVWKKHEALIDQNVIANAWEAQKRRCGALFAQLVETQGQLDFVLRDAARLERDKSEILRGGLEQHEKINAYAHRVAELEGALDALNDITIEYTDQIARNERLVRENDELRAANLQAGVEKERAHGESNVRLVEIQRLNGLLDMIYSSRTWKMHTMIEKLRGRG